MDIKLPELGEGIESGDVISVLVAEGDVVEKDQGLIELETDKASVEIPTTHAGKITKIHVQEGQTLNVGGVIVSLETSDADTGEPTSPAQGEEDSTAAALPTDGQEQAERPASPPAVAEDRSGDEPAPQAAQPLAEAASSPAQRARPAAAGQPASPATPSTTPRGDNGDVIPAGPAMRRFAREVGVDLHKVDGTGDGGRITRGDVLRVVREGTKPVATSMVEAPVEETISPSSPEDVVAPSEPAQRPTSGGAPTHDDWGPVRVEKMTKIRQTIANKMFESWSTIPRVTNFDDADVTELEQVRQASKADYAAAGVKLTQMPFIIKACAMALRANPIVNASIDQENGRIVYKEYVNIGIAVDTERGLVVPSLRNADKLAIPDIARLLEQLSVNVRTGNFGVEDLRGSTFTISNLGAIGGTYSTPIINPPEAAILLLGRSRKMPVVVDHQFAVRLQMPLSLSYDHRLVDGAAAARFLNDVKGFLQSPSRLLLAP